MSVVLIGLPAAGKTTIGVALAAKLGLPFIDTDVMIEEQTGRLIAEIFAEDGEARFRELEAEACAVALTSDGVVSVGGGAILSPLTRERLKAHQVIWLDTSVTTLTRRAGLNKMRPLLLGDLRAKLTELAAERLPLYEQVASFRVNTDQPVVEVVAQIAAFVRGPGSVLVRTDHPYEVLIGRGLGQIDHYVESAGRTVLIHPPVMAVQAAKLAQNLPNPVVLEVPTGERAKTAQELARCWRALAEAGLTRSDVVIGLGGGSTTDLAGFVAATYLRGIDYISMPTTVLGMADAAVGGKTGINLPQGKNLVGAFYEPKLVLCDLDFLSELPDHEIRSGLGEVVKCGFIADPHILDAIEPDPDLALDVHSSAFEEALTRAIRVKADLVSQDFRESTSVEVGRKALNYGHTLGHAIEKIEGFTWSHGYAISVGMVFAAEVARRLGLIGPEVVERHRSLLAALGLPVSFDGADWEEVRQVMSLDKKSRGRHLRLVLLEEIGQVRVVPDVDETVLREAFAAVSSRR